MKKYDRNMSVFEFMKLALDMGLRFSWLRCGAPGFRENILQKLENGESVYDIQSWYDYKYHGIVHSDNKVDSDTAKNNR